MGRQTTVWKVQQAAYHIIKVCCKMRKINEVNTSNYFCLTQIGKLRPQGNWENRVECRIFDCSQHPEYKNLTKSILGIGAVGIKLAFSIEWNLTRNCSQPFVVFQSTTLLPNLPNLGL